MTEYDMVREFMERHNQPLNQDWPNPELALFRLRLIVEENGELAIAIHERNPILTADAYCDLLYVTYGTSLTFGFKNYDRRISSVAPRLKIAHAQPLIQLATVTAQVGLVADAIEGGSGEVVEDCLVDLTVDLFRFSKQFVRFPEMFAEVHRSNMSKSVLNNHGKGGKVGKSGYTPPDLSQFLTPQDISVDSTFNPSEKRNG